MSLLKRVAEKLTRRQLPSEPSKAAVGPADDSKLHFRGVIWQFIGHKDKGVLTFNRAVGRNEKNVLVYDWLDMNAEDLVQIDADRYAIKGRGV